jgi:hypothetical protein
MALAQLAGLLSAVANINATLGINLMLPNASAALSAAIGGFNMGIFADASLAASLSAMASASASLSASATASLSAAASLNMSAMAAVSLAASISASLGMMGISMHGIPCPICTIL